MQEVTTFKDGDIKAEFDGSSLTVHFNSYNSKTYITLGAAIAELGSALALAVKAVQTGKERIVEQSKDTDSPIDLSDIPF
jgi:hypothetical protein